MVDFRYTEEIGEYYDSLGGMKVRDCLCKHVLHIEPGGKSGKVYQISKRMGYKEVKWGYWDDVPDEVNRFNQIYTIKKMMWDLYKNPCRLVIDKLGNLWVDNLHTAILYMFLYGDQISIWEMPIYMIDMSRGSLPVVVSPEEGLVRLNLKDIEGAIACAEKRCLRSSVELVDVGYTIEDFMKENNICRDASYDKLIQRWLLKAWGNDANLKWVGRHV